MQKRSNRSWRKNRDNYQYFLRKADYYARLREMSRMKFSNKTGENK